MSGELEILADAIAGHRRRAEAARDASSPSTCIAGVHRGFRGRTDDWLTPPEVLNALGPFDLDPCCPPDMPWSTAARMISLPEDGLAAEWTGRVFLNSPYGPQTTVWLAKLAAHGDGIALVFARTETSMFFESVWPKASALLFLETRVRFWGRSPETGVFERSKESSGGPSVLIAYDRDPAMPNKLALWRSGLRGAFVHGQIVL